MNNIAIFTRTVMDREETWKPASVETRHRRPDGTWHREKGHTYHHGAPEEYSHQQAAIIHCFHAGADNDRPLRMAAGNADDAKFIFV